MSDNIAPESAWPTWKYVLAAGIPVTLCGICLYMYLGSKKQNDKKISPVKRFEPEGSSSPQRLQETVVEVKDETPSKTKLQEATDLKNEGNRLFKQGKFEEAIVKYTDAINVCPDKHNTEKSTYHQNKAAALEKMQDWQGVIDECSAAVNLNQRYVKALFRRSKGYEKLERKEECLEDITTVCILEGFQNQGSMIYADTMLKQIGKEKAVKKYQDRNHIMPSTLFIKQYFASFNDDIISDDLSDEQKNYSPNSGYVCAKIAMSECNYSSVISECTREIETSEKGAGEDKNDEQQPAYTCEAYLLRGTFNLLIGNSDEAKADLEQVIKMNEANVKLRANALIKRGSMHMQLQEPQLAEADFNQAVELDPENSDVFHHRGQLYILLDQVDKALADFDKCTHLKPDFAMAHAQRCYTMYRQAFAQKDVVQTQSAIQRFEDIIKEYPTCSETYGLYAQALTDSGNFEKADQLFKDAINIEPENATLFVHRGLLALQWKQDIDEAVRLISKALTVDDKCDFAHETMGTIEVQRGNLDKAIEHFGVAIDFAKSELEMAHLFALQAAALAQGNIARKYGLKPPMPPGM